MTTTPPTPETVTQPESGAAVVLQRLVSRPSIHHIGVSGGKDSTALLLWAVYESGLDPASLDVTFSDTGNEHPITYAYVQMLSDKVHPITTLHPERDFFALANHKKRFPSPKARFCTTELKMKPARDHVWALKEQGHHVTLMTGVRGAESHSRAKLPEREMDNYYGLPVWRPLLRWTIEEVWAIHARHGLEPNPLYGFGMKRVGCYPCIMSRKSEIARIATLWPERIDQLTQRESEVPSVHNMSTFFCRDKVPKIYRSKTINTRDGRRMQVPTARDVARWAMDGAEVDRARAVQEGRQSKFEFDQTAEDAPVCASTYGACE